MSDGPKGGVNFISCRSGTPSLLVARKGLGFPGSRKFSMARKWGDSLAILSPMYSDGNLALAEALARVDLSTAVACASRPPPLSSSKRGGGPSSNPLPLGAGTPTLARSLSRAVFLYGAASELGWVGGRVSPGKVFLSGVGTPPILQTSPAPHRSLRPPSSGYLGKASAPGNTFCRSGSWPLGPGAQSIGVVN